MTKEVKIRLYSIQKSPDGEEETIELVTTGEYFYKNEKHYILYEESVEGETVWIKNRIKIAGDHMELTKSGPVSTTMYFREGSRERTLYHTPYGTMAMETDTGSMKVEAGEDEIHIEIAYGLYIEEEFTADCRIQIQITSV